MCLDSFSRGYERGQELIIWALESGRVKPTHGSCCTCQTCGWGYDDCICEYDELKKTIVMNMLEEFELDSMFGLSDEDYKTLKRIENWLRNW